MTSKSFQRAAAALILLYPGIPLLFMGEENAVDAPFPFFVDFEEPQLRRAVNEERRREYPRHEWGRVNSPTEDATFYATICHASHGDAEMFAWYRELIGLRKMGIAEGWLTPNRMTTNHDPDRDIFSLRYHRNDGGLVVVRSRLSGAGKPGAQFAPCPIEGSIVLSSEKISDTRNKSVLMRANHALASMA